MLCGAEDHGGGGLVARIPDLTRKTETFIPLKGARLASHTRLYEEHRNLNKASGTQVSLAYGFKFKIVSFNVRSLLKATMHRQIIDYMRRHDIYILCMQETRSKKTTQYVVDNFTFLIISTMNTSQPEYVYAGVGFVLSPMAWNALLRTSFINSRIACISVLMRGGELNILNTYVR